MAKVLQVVGAVLALAGGVAQNALAQQAASAPAASTVAGGYRLGPDDVLEVDVLGQSEFKTRAKVRADGTILLPYLGAVSVTGQTPISFSQDVAAKLRAGGYYAKPIVNTEVVSYASRYVIMQGEVGSPGLQPVDRDYRVSEVIARAGGIKPTGADYVMLRRASGEEVRLPYDRIAHGGAADDPLVSAGDKIYVPVADLFYIYGQVNGPGAFPLQRGMTLRMALARAGGLTPSGSASKVKVFHDGKPQPVNLERPIEAGDVVVGGERLF